MTALHLSDDTFLRAPAKVVAGVVGEAARWTGWWPGQTWTTTRDRGEKGRHWAVSGAMTGTAEVWLEPWDGGVVLHFFLRADPVNDTWSPRRRGREWRSASRRWKRVVHALKDELEAGGR